MEHKSYEMFRKLQYAVTMRRKAAVHIKQDLHMSRNVFKRMVTETRGDKQ